MHKIPFEVLIHSENALIKAREMNALLIKLIEVPEGGEESGVLMFAAIQTLLSPVLMNWIRQWQFTKIITCPAPENKNNET